MRNNLPGTLPERSLHFILRSRQVIKKLYLTELTRTDINFGESHFMPLVYTEV